MQDVNEGDRLLRPGQVAVAEGVGPTTIYKRIAAGEYGEVFKDGDLTVIPWRNVLERRKRFLKPARYGARKGVFGIPPKAEATA